MSGGSFDQSFDQDGVATTPVSDTGNKFDRAFALAITPGRLIAAGDATSGPTSSQPALVSYNQSDTDNDGVPDALDNCPSVANPHQSNIDHDTKGDVCDPDVDGDGRPNAKDNCPLKPNPGQRDTDKDGIGDVCDKTPRGKHSRGNDTLVGTGKADTIHGLAGNDTILGLAANDKLFGDAGNDTLNGGKGNDVLVGGKGRDVFKGGPGDDTIKAADGVAESVDCGPGRHDEAIVDKQDTVKGCEQVTRK
jgi:thrombospondin type 3 repeat protein/hemolysin type calcium-binding protein